MNRLFSSFTSFSRTERMGILALLFLLAALITIRAAIPFFFRPATDIAQQQKLVQVWQNFSNNAVPDTATPPHRPDVATTVTPQAKRTVGPGKAGAKASLFPFDPNTIDSAGLRLLGLREKTTSIFLHWRAKGKKFYKKDELKKLYTLTEDEYNRLEPYIVIDKELIK